MKHSIIPAFLLATALCAQQPPTAMMKMVVQRAGSDVQRDSFAAKPKTLYRAGTTYCRVEEQPDPANGIHGVVIINEPDMWMVNLADETARHFVDSGPSLICHMPLFGDRQSGMPQEIGELEFGREMEFFKSHGAVAQQGPILQSQQTIGYKLQFGDWEVALFTYKGPERPAAVAMVHGDENFTYYYSGYGTMAFDATLFAKPSGVKIEEAKQ